MLKASQGRSCGPRGKGLPGPRHVHARYMNAQSDGRAWGRASMLTHRKRSCTNHYRSEYASPSQEGDARTARRSDEATPLKRATRNRAAGRRTIARPKNGPAPNSGWAAPGALALWRGLSAPAQAKSVRGPGGRFANRIVISGVAPSALVRRDHLSFSGANVLSRKLVGVFQACAS